MKKRILAIVLCCMMLLSTLSSSAFANMTLSNSSDTLAAEQWETGEENVSGYSDKIIEETADIQSEISEETISDTISEEAAAEVLFGTEEETNTDLSEPEEIVSESVPEETLPMLVAYDAVTEVLFGTEERTPL